MTIRVALLGAFAALMTTSPVVGQDNPLGQPLLDANGNIRDDAYIHIPLRPDDARYGDIQSDELKAWLMEVDAISLADRDRGNLFWGRNVGTQGHEDTQAWVERYFREYGLEDVHHEEFELGPVWSPERYSISFKTGGRTFALPSCTAATITAGRQHLHPRFCRATGDCRSRTCVPKGRPMQQ